MKNINKKMAICMLVLSMYTPVSALSKTETVYSKLNYNGVVTDTIVNELLVNDKELDTINDYSTLTDIINISDDNEFTNNNNKLTFNARYHATRRTANHIPSQTPFSYVPLFDF